jgi:hypothetical protein
VAGYTDGLKVIFVICSALSFWYFVVDMRSHGNAAGRQARLAQSAISFHYQLA